MSSKKKKPRKTKFLKRDSLSMIADLEKGSYTDIYQTCMEKIGVGIHLQRYDSRRKFVEGLGKDAVREVFLKCVKMMVDKYLALFKLYLKGKRFAQFEQAWFNYLEEYFTEKSSCQKDPDSLSAFSMWKTVVDKSECKLNVEEQRIVVATVAYTVYDIMSEKIKDYKTGDLIDSAATSSSVTTYCCDSPETVFVESNVSLYRYGGFALHSLLKKYSTEIQTSCSRDRDIVLVLKQLKITDKQISELPNGIRHLNQGGLDIMNPCMLPYLRAVIEKVASLVNENRCCELGQHMIEVACKHIEDDVELSCTFVKCIEDAGVNLDKSATIIPRLHSELSKKMFHARVNEYFTASTEIELQRSGKAVKAEQSLRDQLKTFSAMKRRS